MLVFYLRRDLRKYGVFRKVWIKLIFFVFWYFFSYMIFVYRIFVRVILNRIICIFVFVVYYCCFLELLVFFISWEVKERIYFCFIVKELFIKYVLSFWVSNRRIVYNFWVLLFLFIKIFFVRVKISFIFISYLKMKEKEMFFWLFNYNNVVYFFIDIFVDYDWLMVIKIRLSDV